jgi:hypothetical protein
VQNQDVRAAGYVLPVRDWILDEPRIYAPLVLLAGMALAMGRRLFGVDVASRVAQFALLYTATLWAYRFVATSSVIETWWANAMLATSMAFAGAVLLHEVDRRGSRGLAVVALPMGIAAAVGLAVRSSDIRSVELYNDVRGSSLRLGVLIAAALLVGLAARRAGVVPRILGATAILSVATWLALTPAQYLGVGRTGEFSGVPRDEWRGYNVAHRLEQLVNAADTPNARRLVWYPEATGLLQDVWVTLPHVGGSVNPYEAPEPDMTISEYGRGRLRYPTTASVVVIAEDTSLLEAARRNLRANRVTYRAEPTRSWAGGRVHVQVLHLRDREGGGNRDAVQTSADAFLDAAAARRAEDACRFVVLDLTLALARQHGSCSAALAPSLRTERLGTRPGAITIDGDLARVTVADTGRILVFRRFQSQWQLAGGQVSFAP